MPEQVWFLNTLVTFRVSADDGDDRISLLESLAPRGDSPPLHTHEEDEVFHILEGDFRFRVGERELRAGAGETVMAPRRIPHTYRVESETGRWLVVTHGDFERLVRSFSRPAERPELPEPDGAPSAEQQHALADACRRFGIELVGPPL